MIRLVDELLRATLMQGVHALAVAPGGGIAVVDPQQIGFQPPDQDWRTQVANLSKNAINLYLIEMHENRRQRTLQRARRVENGQIEETRFPARLDCHYLVSVQSPTTPSAQVDPTPEEHAILYEAARALIRIDPLNASRIYSAAALALVPPRLRNIDFPLTVAPSEGHFKIAEFWGTMGEKHRWKPILHLIVTLPIEFATESPGPRVTTRILDYMRTDDGTLLEQTIAIGGVVYDGSSPALGVVVSLKTVAGALLRQVTTDATGRFLFDGLSVGSYDLNALAPDQRTVATTTAAPSPTGSYDLILP